MLKVPPDTLISKPGGLPELGPDHTRLYPCEPPVAVMVTPPFAAPKQGLFIMLLALIDGGVLGWFIVTEL